MRRNIIPEAELKPYGPAHPNQPQEINGIVYFFLLNRVYRGFFKCHTLRKKIKCFGYKTEQRCSFSDL